MYHLFNIYKEVYYNDNILREEHCVCGCIRVRFKNNKKAFIDDKGRIISYNPFPTCTRNGGAEYISKHTPVIEMSAYKIDDSLKARFEELIITLKLMVDEPGNYKYTRIARDFLQSEECRAILHKIKRQAI